MEREGADLVEAAVGLAERFRGRIDGFLGARCLDRSLVLAHPSVHDVDPLKLVVDLTGTGAGGRRRRPGRRRDHLPLPARHPRHRPGELLTTDLLDALRDEAQAGSRMAGASDPTLLETLLVVRA